MDAPPPIDARPVESAPPVDSSTPFDSSASTLTSAERLILLKTLNVTAGAIGLVLVLYAYFVPELVQDLKSGAIPWFLTPATNLLQTYHARYADQADYFWQVAGRVMLTRFILGVIITALLVTGIRFRDRVRHFITAFFQTPDYPLNLAITRMVIFALILTFAKPDAYRELLKVPLEFRDAPFGFGWMMPLIPVPEHIGIPLIALFAGSCLAAILGIATRITIPLAAVLTFYCLGLPQSYGKVNHWHHLFWFSVILAASPCADVLSFDAWWRHRSALKRGDELAVPSRGPAYGRPLRIMWVLLAVAYIGPGFWKLWKSGLDWMTGENLRWLLYWQWYAMDWIPQVRVDQIPFILDIGAIGTVLFELGFIFAVWWRQSRWFFIWWGLAFHIGVYLTLRVNFELLMKSYVIFVDWAGWLRRVPDERLRSWIDGTGILPGREQAGRVVGWLGAIMILWNWSFAIIGIEDGWPFSSYPRYAGIHGIHFQTETPAMALDLRHRDGRTTSLDAKALKAASGLGNTQYDLLIRNFMKEREPEVRLDIVNQMTMLLFNRGEIPADVTSVRAFVEISTIDPNEQSRNPIRREEYASIPWRPPSDVPE